MRLTLLLISAMLPTTCFAGELPDNPLVQAMLLDERAPVATESFLHEPLSLGPISVDVGVGLLGPVAQVLGGRVVDRGKGDYRWACVMRDNRAVWIISDKSDAPTAEPVVTAIVITAAPVDEAECLASSNIELDFSIPPIGASLGEVEVQLGGSGNTGNEIVAYRQQATLGDPAGSWLVISTLAYHLQEGVTDAISFDVAVIR
jgi:hypothetical protein